MLARPGLLSQGVTGAVCASSQVKVGDTLDLLIGKDKDAETEAVMRILLKKVFEEKTAGDKYRVVLRRWKHVRLPRKGACK